MDKKYLSNDQQDIRNILIKFTKDKKYIFIQDYKNLIIEKILPIMDFIKVEDINKNKNELIHILKQKINPNITIKSNENSIRLSKDNIIFFFIGLINNKTKGYDHCFYKIPDKSDSYIIKPQVLVNMYEKLLNKMDLHDRKKFYDKELLNIENIRKKIGIETNMIDPYVFPIKKNDQDINMFKINNFYIEFINTSLTDITEIDVWVNAASINSMEMNGWGGVAGALREKIKKEGNIKIFSEDWKRYGKMIQKGTSRFVKDNLGNPVKIINEKYIIHAGSPTNLDGNVLELIISAYKSIFENIYIFNNNHSEKIKSVAIPPLGIGIYGVSADDSVRGLINAILFYSKRMELRVVIPLYEFNTNNSNTNFYNIFLARIGSQT